MGMKTPWRPGGTRPPAEGRRGGESKEAMERNENA
jgi:hypothetical protein